MSEQPVQDFYDRLSFVYHGFASTPIIRRWRERSIRGLQLEGDEVVVDAGCGTGANIDLLWDELSTEGSIVAVDISDGQLQNASVKSGRGVTPIQADASQLPVRKADAVYSSFTVGLFEEPGVVVDRWLDVLDSGDKIGLLHVVEPQSASKAVNLPLELFTGMATAGASLDEKVRKSVSGEALAQLDRKVRQAHRTVRESCRVLDEKAFLRGSVRSISGQKL